MVADASPFAGFDLASLLEKHRIKRVPVMQGGKIIGIVVAVLIVVFLLQR